MADILAFRKTGKCRSQSHKNMLNSGGSAQVLPFTGITRVHEGMKKVLDAAKKGGPTWPNKDK